MFATINTETGTRPPGHGKENILKPKTLVFFNNKGGVAKTTVVCTLATLLSERGKKVLVIDLDPSSNATHYFFKKRDGSQNEFKTGTIKNILDPEDPMSNIDRVIRKAERVDISVVPSEEELDLVEMAMTRKIPDEIYATEYNSTKLVQEMDLNQEINPEDPKFTLRLALEKMKSEFDVILIDCHPTRVSMLNTNALQAADYVFVPVDHDIEAIEGLGSLLLTIDKATKTGNPDLKIGGVFLVKYTGGKVDLKRALPELVSSLSRNSDKCRLMESVIPFSAEQDHARWLRRSFFKKKSAGAVKLTEAYNDLLDEIIEIIGGID